MSAYAAGNHDAITPITRHEKFIAALSGDIDVPDPITREEKFWSEIAQNAEKTLGPASIVSFIGRSHTRILECTASIAPVQDLHGYDSPWVDSAYNQAPYNFRAIQDAGMTRYGNSEIDKIVGGTVAWNQLVNTGDTSVTVPNGHKYYSRINSVQTIGASTGAAISINDASEDNVFDLTQMFGSTIADYLYTLESGTAGAGVAKLKSWGFCTAPYYAYDAGTLLSVKTSAHKTIGFNQWDKTNIEDGYVNDTTGAIGGTNTSKNTGYIRVVGGATYHVRTDATSGKWGAWYDSDKNYISSANPSPSNNMNITAPQNAAYLRSTVSYRGNGNPDTFCINLHWDGERGGEYEPYEEHTYALDSYLELRGILKLDANNNLYYDGDVYAPDGTVTRKYGMRAYASGDESLANAITDGTNTVYKLNTSTTESADPYQETQICDARWCKRTLSG